MTNYMAKKAIAAENIRLTESRERLEASIKALDTQSPAFHCDAVLILTAATDRIEATIADNTKLLASLMNHHADDIDMVGNFIGHTPNENGWTP